MVHFLYSLEIVKENLSNRKTRNLAFHEDSIKGITKEELVVLEKRGFIRVESISSNHTWYEPTNKMFSDNNEGVFEKVELPKDLFNVIVGYDDIKRLLKTMICSNNPTHYLLEEPPSSAKTLFLLELDRIEGAKYILGSNTTIAGLNQLLETEMPQVLLIDEIDKIKSETNLAVLHSLMETGILVTTKHDEHIRMQLKTKVIASCNDSSFLSSPLLSKFGNPFYFKPYTKEEFVEIVIRRLTTKECIANDTAEQIAYIVHDGFKSKDIREAIKIGRMVKEGLDLNEVMATMNKYTKR